MPVLNARNPWSSGGRRSESLLPTPLPLGTRPGKRKLLGWVCWGRFLLSSCQLSLARLSQEKQSDAVHLPCFASFSSCFSTCCSQLTSRSLPSCLRCCAGWQRGVSPFLLLRVTLTSSAWPGEQAAPNRGRRSQMRDSRGGRSEVTLAEQRQGRSGSGTSKARTPLHPPGCDDPACPRPRVPRVFVQATCSSDSLPGF